MSGVAAVLASQEALHFLLIVVLPRGHVMGCSSSLETMSCHLLTTFSQTLLQLWELKHLVAYPSHAVAESEFEIYIDSCRTLASYRHMHFFHHIL